MKEAFAMDNYPAHLAPQFHPSGAVSTPFEQWWANAQPSFTNVPEEVARQWLHRHWKHSPYSYLIAKNYIFKPKQWGSLRDIRTSWSEFKEDNAGAMWKGKDLVKSMPGFMPYVPKYMLANKAFPAPIIVLDNHDGHHGRDYPKEHPLPDAFVLVEGHTRFNTGIYLQSIGQLERADVWLVKRV
jgi:hypothetical protein